MTPTDDIRARLDGLGVEHEKPTSGLTVAQIGGVQYRFYEHVGPETNERDKGKVFVVTEWLTPEQAIAATVGGRDYTYDEWRAINDALGDAMEYAHDHAILYPDKADPLWNIDEYVNRVLEVAYGNKSREPKVVAEWRSVALGLFDSLEKADLEVAQRWLCENDLLGQEIAYGDAKAATVGAGTCHMEVHDNLDESEGMGDVWLECDKCHWQMMLEPTTPRFKHCPNCTRRVVSE